MSTSGTNVSPRTTPRSADRDAIAALQRLQKLSERLLGVRQVDAAVAELLDAAIDLVRADFAVVQLIDQSSGMLEIAATHGMEPALAAEVYSTPLIGAGGHGMGVLSIHPRGSANPNEAEREALVLAAQLATAAIERLRAGERVHENERRYVTLFESIDQAFAVVEVVLDENQKPADYRFLETNSNFERHTGLEHVAGRTARELVPTLEPIWIETLARVALTGEPQRFTQRVQGLERWLDCYAFRFGSPRDRQVAVFFRDVSDQRLAEQRDRFLLALDDATRSLAQPEEISATVARLLGEHLHADRVVYTEVDEDEDGLIITGEWSPLYPSVLGRYRFSDYGETLRAALRAGRPLVIEDVSNSTLTHAESERYAEHQIIALVQVPLHKREKLGSSLGVYQNAPRRWRDEEVELVRAVANRCWEAIERARVANRLRDSEEQFRTLANLLPQFIWTARPDGYIYWFNDYAHEFFGREKAIEGSGWMEFHDPDLIGEIERGYLEALAAGTPYSCTTRFLNRHGEYRWLIARMVPQRDAQGHVLRFLGYNFDVTDLYETQGRLVEADRRKDEFLATLAHELRNPLAPLYNMLEILKLKGGQGVNTELREVMHRQVQHLGRLVDDLLDASRITRGVIELQRESVLLSDVLAAAIETSRPLIEASTHRLQVEVLERPLWLHADAVRLTQVFANLLNNAAKYTDTNGQIGIRVAAEDGEAIVTVSDSGIGIPREMLGRVFELFTQVDRHSGRGQGGLGIGLSLSRSLVEMHGGTLEAESDGIGLGSRFTVRLPLASIGETVAESRREEPATPSAAEIELLVVDDNVDAAESLAMVLRSLGGEVQVAYDGAAALALLERNSFSGAFVDLGMPGIDGLEVARRIRSQARFADLLLVAVTGWGQDSDRARSREAGFDHHLVKPAEISALQAVLTELRARCVS